MRSSKPIAVLGVVALLCFSTPCQGAIFKGLGTGTSLTIEGLSGDGSTVFGKQNGDMFRWKLSEQPRLITNLPNNVLGLVHPNAISYDGSVLVGSYLYKRFDKAIPPFNDILTISLYEAFAYSANTGSFTRLGFLDEAVVDEDSASAIGVSADGSVIVGGSTSGSGSRAFRWTASGGMEGLPHPTELSGKFVSSMSDVSADGNKAIGRVVSTFGSPPPDSPMAMWTAAEGTFLLENPDGSYFHTLPSPNKLSADGSTVIGEGLRLYRFLPQAWRWTEETGMTYLEDVAVDNQTDGSNAVDVSADGSIIVGELRRENRSGPMIWDEVNGARFVEDYFRNELELDLGSWTLSTVISVSDDGQTFVGRGTNPDGQHDYWLVTTPLLSGDFNLDGTVDTADYVVWRKNGGLPEEYDLWRANFGKSSSGTAALSATIPEPAAIVLLVIALLCCKHVRPRLVAPQKHGIF